MLHWMLRYSIVVLLGYDMVKVLSRDEVFPREFKGKGNVYGSGVFSVGATNFTIGASLTSGEVLDGLTGKTTGSYQYPMQVLDDAGQSLRYYYNFPSDFDNYNSFFRSEQRQVALILYPTSAGNTRSNYSPPHVTHDEDIPKMQVSGDNTYSVATGSGKFPLVVWSHGQNATWLDFLSIPINLASRGYVCAILFHGDDRYGNNTAGYIAELQNRNLSVIHLINQLETEIPLAENIDWDNIGIVGRSYGSSTLTCCGAQISSDNSPIVSVTDSRIKCWFGLVPYFDQLPFGAGFEMFGTDDSGLSGVSVPVMLLSGANDSTSTTARILSAADDINSETSHYEIANTSHAGWSTNSKTAIKAWISAFFNYRLKGDANDWVDLIDSPTVGQTATQQYKNF